MAYCAILITPTPNRQPLSTRFSILADSGYIYIIMPILFYNRLAEIRTPSCVFAVRRCGVGVYPEHAVHEGSVSPCAVTLA